MAVVALALVPHTPLLVPAIGGDHRQLLKRTVRALEQFDAELYALQPDYLVIVTPHGKAAPTAMSGFVSEHIHGSLENFGDLTDRVERPGAPVLAHRMKDRCRRARLPFRLTTVVNHDYGVTVPILLLPQTTARTHILPLTLHGLETNTIRHYAEVLWDELHSNRKRVVVLASVNLSHRPEGLAATESPYDQAVVTALRSGEPAAILSLDPRIVDEANTCSHQVLGLAAAWLERIRSRPRSHSYEAPLGIGQLTALYPLL